MLLALVGGPPPPRGRASRWTLVFARIWSDILFRDAANIALAGW